MQNLIWLLSPSLKFVLEKFSFFLKMCEMDHVFEWICAGGKTLKYLRFADFHFKTLQIISLGAWVHDYSSSTTPLQWVMTKSILNTFSKVHILSKNPSDKITLFENHSKCRTFWILAFSTNFCPILVDLPGNTVWLQALVFQNSTKYFWHF